jgi:hypothetical protein
MGPEARAGVIVAGRTVAIAVADDGVDTLNPRELAAVEQGW